MERRQLESFVAVVDTGGFHAAAKRLFITQSAVSQSLKALEQELGEPLLLRPAGGKGAPGLSEAGKRLLPIAREILQRIEKGKQVVKDLSKVLTGRLTIGAVDVAALYHLPDPLRRFNSAHPELEITVRVAGSRALEQGIRAGELDLAFLLAPATPRGLAGRPFRDDPLAAVAPVELIESLGSRPDPAELAKLGWITYPRGTVSRGIIEAAFKRAGLPFPVSMEIDRPEAILQLVRAGLGLAVLPERLLESCDGHAEIRRIELPGVAATRPIRILHSPEARLTPAARTFLADLKPPITGRA